MGSVPANLTYASTKSQSLMAITSVEDDGLYLPIIKTHSFEKLHRHNLYAEIFAKSMRKKWPQLAYIGLYSGAGRARVEETGQIVETAPMSALRLSPGFTHYVFVDKDPRCISALRQRVAALPSNAEVTFLEGEVNALAQKVRQSLPRYEREKGLLSFCFVDPFAADIHFSTIRTLGDLKMDFLLLLMLGVDARRNFTTYRSDPTSTRIGDLIDCANWREEFVGKSSRHVISFLLRKFDEAMVRIGYRSASEGSYHRVTVSGKNVLQYILVLYSKHNLGEQFWKECLASANPQETLDL